MMKGKNYGRSLEFILFFTMRAIPIASAASCRFNCSSVRLNIFLITASISSLLELPFQLIYFLISWGVRSNNCIV